MVPDPLTKEMWEKVVGEWRTRGEEFTLMEWIIHSRCLTETVLKQSLAAGTGSRMLEEILPVCDSEKDASSSVLENNGFLVGKDSENRKVVAGGKELPPSLEEYLGVNHFSWEWVLLNPVRKSNSKPDFAAGSEKESSPDQSTLMKRVESLLIEASANFASDIHFERFDGRLVIRRKERGGMENMGIWKEPECSECLRILKRQANISTAQLSLPQDGRLEVKQGPSRLSFRVSHIHAVNGESLVLRLIGKESILPEPEQLGMPSTLSTRAKTSLLYERGIVLCTGSTGSGKTTTMCSLISSLNKHCLKILTIEDPIEFDLSNATQCAVNPSTGWTFSEALKAFLRQDPDIIMIGEIRDEESAAMACRAGLTGHSVLSSLHAHSPVAALDRLQAWGLAPGILAESIRLVIHQKLTVNPKSKIRKAHFKWISGDPDEIYSYYLNKTIPASWPVPDNPLAPSTSDGVSYPVT
ncbi:Flp pilus assembly complex ATPase component [Puniceicoccales bacterium CK1056]|uniref:Flp pilus assembly complex ATPase component n=1 Tax=Oceanipulchritudo coccoides TaxID=2706888 RepID=A0A6B2M2U0_9BACT|nr:ATPase, T2SS/T4P/T4SS family [Oceanipulchritudo coccoides]NDV62125.1 Flp pilus assembly complex ATPase component [Oceanipulchritudo coccoides]